MFDTIIRGGTVIDGLRTPRFRADIGIKDGKVASIGRIHNEDGARVLDAEGLIVAPGFVDLHTHYDSQVYWDPYCSISGWHGVTSVVIGNCGFGFAPVRTEDQERAMLTMARNEAVPMEAMREGMAWDWETYPEFLDSLQRTPKGINVLSYVGLNPLMAYVMGIEAAKSRPATEAEREEMCRLFEEALEAGACGFSVQLGGEGSVQRDYDGTPMITDLMSEQDLLAFAAVMGKVGKGFAQISGPFDAAEKVAAVSGRPVIWNLLAPATDQHGQNTPPHRLMIEKLEEANAKGLRIFAQALTVDVGFEFNLEDWNLFDSSPVWREVTIGTREERMRKMREPEQRRALREEFDAGHGPIAGGGTESQMKAAGGGANVSGIAQLTVEEVESPDLKHYEGHGLAEIAENEGKHIIDAFLDLSLADDLQATFVTPPRPTDPEAMAEVANSSVAIPGVSDGGAHTKFITLGAYPTEFLARWVRDAGIMDLEQAHWRLSAYPALAAGFRDRGCIREGAPADIVIYDYEKLEMLPIEKAWDFPAGAWRRVRKAEGYRYTLVNGEVTFEDRDCTGATPGQLLRHGSA